MEILVTEFKIQRAVRHLGEEISKKYKDTDTVPVMVCVLNGAFMFFTDLVKNMDCEVEVDFVRAKSYHGKDNSGGVTITKEVELDIEGRDVYIVEDIIDSGATIKAIKYMLKKKKAKSVKVVTLLERKGKPSRADYTALTIGDEWVVGYGLDDDGLKRNYRNIYAL